MNPSSISLLRIPASLLYKDEIDLQEAGIAQQLAEHHGNMCAVQSHDRHGPSESRLTLIPMARAPPLLLPIKTSLISIQYQEKSGHALHNDQQPNDCLQKPVYKPHLLLSS
jgi:hypothetical protein